MGVNEGRRIMAMNRCTTERKEKKGTVNIMSRKKANKQHQDQEEENMSIG